jgi:tripartite-type tricarboxylate transporter receptor subunit TctC
MSHTSERRQLLTGTGAALASAVISAPLRAQGKSIVPGGTLKIVVGYAVGGGTDVIIRAMSDRLKDAIGANIVIENRPGASGMLAPAQMKTAPADGSVICFTPGVSTIEQRVSKKSIPFDLADLAPISLAGTVPTVYCVSSTLGLGKLADYVNWVKANPKQANFGTAAMGSTTHFFGIELGNALGLQLQPIAYKGTGPLLTDIVAGHVPAGCGGLTSFLQHHRSGKVNILTVSSGARSLAAPELPTVSEQGFPKLSSEGFYSFWAPARTPPEVLEALSREIRAALEPADIRQRLLGLGLETRTSTPAELRDYQAQALAKFAASFKAGGGVPE